MNQLQEETLNERFVDTPPREVPGLPVWALRDIPEEAGHWLAEHLGIETIENLAHFRPARIAQELDRARRRPGSRGGKRRPRGRVEAAEPIEMLGGGHDKHLYVKISQVTIQNANGDQRTVSLDYTQELGKVVGHNRGTAPQITKAQAMKIAADHVSLQPGEQIVDVKFDHFTR